VVNHPTLTFFLPQKRGKGKRGGTRREIARCRNEEKNENGAEGGGEKKEGRVHKTMCS